MSLLHLIHVGYFERHGDLVRFSNSPLDPILRPVVTRPLDEDKVRQIVKEVGGGQSCNTMLPESWGMWYEDGYISGDRYALSAEAIRFLDRLIQQTGADLVDFNARSVIDIDQLRL